MPRARRDRGALRKWGHRFRRLLGLYITRYKYLENTHIIIDGECNSACTLVLGNHDVCATDRGFFYFHAARDPQTGAPRTDSTAIMMMSYPKKVRDWIVSKGGLTTEWMGVHAQMFLPKCEDGI